MLVWEVQSSSCSKWATRWKNWYCWSEDPAIVVANALSPAEVQRVNVDKESKRLDVILTEENLSKAIGRRGQNVRLATKLLNYEINIMTDRKTLKEDN